MIVAGVPNDPPFANCCFLNVKVFSIFTLPVTVKLELKETSPLTNIFCPKDTSLPTNKLLLKDASPFKFKRFPTVKLPLKDESKLTNIFPPNEASLPKNKFVLNDASPLRNNLLFNDASLTNIKFPPKDTSL